MLMQAWIIYEQYLQRYSSNGADSKYLHSNQYFLPQRPGVLSGGSDVDDQAVAQHGHDPEDGGENRWGPDSLKFYVTCKSKT